MRSDVQVQVITSGTFLPTVLKCCTPLQDNTHLKNHAGLHSASKIQRVDDSTIFSMYHLVVTPFHVAMSDAVFTVAVDEVVKILLGGDV